MHVKFDWGAEIVPGAKMGGEGGLDGQASFFGICACQ